jgi:hypothetical protein
MEKFNFDEWRELAQKDKAAIETSAPKNAVGCKIIKS